MRRTLMVLATISAFSVAACTPEQEAKWASTIAAIKSGARIAADTARATIDEVCGYSPALVMTANTSASIAASQGKEWAVRDINNATAALSAVCDTPTSGSSASSLANLAVRAWNAYKAVQAADAAARG